MNVTSPLFPLRYHYAIITDRMRSDGVFRTGARRSADNGTQMTGFIGFLGISLNRQGIVATGFTLPLCLCFSAFSVVKNGATASAGTGLSRRYGERRYIS